MRLFEAAIKRALLSQDGKHLRRIADRLVAHAANAKKLDLVAVKEVLDRIDGKPRQQVEMSGPGGGMIEVSNGGELGRARRVAFLLAQGALAKASESAKSEASQEPEKA